MLTDRRTKNFFDIEKMVKKFSKLSSKKLVHLLAWKLFLNTLKRVILLRRKESCRYFALLNFVCLPAKFIPFHFRPLNIITKIF